MRLKPACHPIRHFGWHPAFRGQVSACGASAPWAVRVWCHSGVTGSPIVRPSWLRQSATQSGIDTVMTTRPATGRLATISARLVQSPIVNGTAVPTGGTG
jgi:hypothetical protein